MYIYIYGIVLHIVGVYGITWYSYYTSFIILHGFNHIIIYIDSIHITCAIHMVNIYIYIYIYYIQYIHVKKVKVVVFVCDSTRV